MKFLALLPLLLGILASCSNDRARVSQTVEQAMSGPYTSAGLDRSRIKDQQVIGAMSRVPRHRFVPESVAEQAYSDRALPIGEGQTISQPYIVALMSQEAKISSGSKVLEIGTGSGYQAAVLAELGAEVFSVEIVEKLAERAAFTLNSLGYTTVRVQQGDGWRGWPEHAPFDAILVTAASPSVPPALVEQLAQRGRLIIPIERPGAKGEDLMLYERDGSDLISRSLGPVVFVPLTGAVRTD